MLFGHELFLENNISGREKSGRLVNYLIKII